LRSGINQSASIARINETALIHDFLCRIVTAGGGGGGGGWIAIGYPA